MTFARLKKLVKALQIGDNNPPKDDEEFLALLAYAYDKTATYADALKLFTSNKDAAILRQGPGNTFVRKPKLPKRDTDELDIDDELGYPIARFIASFISKTKIQLHEAEAMSLIRAYNAKVHSYLETLQMKGEISETVSDINV